jgi:hypothetical protein
VPPLHRADEFEVFQFLNIEDIYDEDLTWFEIWDGLRIILI